MNHDSHTITLTDHQLELLAIAYQTAIHRAADNELMAKMGDMAFLASMMVNQETYSKDWDDLQAKIIAPAHNRIKAMSMGDQYI